MDQHTHTYVVYFVFVLIHPFLSKINPCRRILTWFVFARAVTRGRSCLNTRWCRVTWGMDWHRLITIDLQYWDIWCVIILVISKTCDGCGCLRKYGIFHHDCFFGLYVMWSSKVSLKSEILILRYSQTKEVFPFVSFCFGNFLIADKF